MDKTLKLIFEGVYDPDSYLHVLLGKPHLILMIWDKIKDGWSRHIKKPSSYKYRELLAKKGKPGDVTGSDVAFIRELDRVRFPEPTNINVTMMPFVASCSFAETKLPEYIRPYAAMISAVVQSSFGYNNINQKRAEGKIYFLTVHEYQTTGPEEDSRRCSRLRTVNLGKTTRNRKRETTKAIKRSADDDGAFGIASSSSAGAGSCDLIICKHHSNRRRMKNDATCHSGGIYVASSTPNSQRVWDCKIEADPSTGEETIEKGGDINHLRMFLPVGDALELEGNTLYWMTDRTPHETLPLECGNHQYFQVVTSQLSAWFTDWYSNNPNGVKSDQSITAII